MARKNDWQRRPGRAVSPREVRLASATVCQQLQHRVWDALPPEVQEEVPVAPQPAPSSAGGWERLKQALALRTQAGERQDWRAWHALNFAYQMVLETTRLYWDECGTAEQVEVAFAQLQAVLDAQR